VADKCEAEIDIPILPGINLEKAWQEILSLLNNFPVIWEKKSFDPPFEISKEEKIVKDLEKCVSPYISVKYTGMPAWTDAANLLEKGIWSVIFGAGDLALAHTTNEHVELDQLIILSHILKDFLENI
jgi:acetylornithine deacetylase/succinyl-diaminopimelate desuccinylase